MPAVAQGNGGVPVAPTPPPRTPDFNELASKPPPNLNYMIGNGYGNLPAPLPGQTPPKPSPQASPQAFNYLTDPGYLAALNAQQQGEAQLRAQLNNQIQQAIIQYGDPALASQADFGMDNQSAAFARQNYLSGNSTKARIDKANQLAQQAIVNHLAGHGLLFSGDYGYDNGQQAQAYANQIYDAQQAVLNAIAGYRSNTLTQEQGLQQSVVQALEQAYTNQVNEEIANAYAYGGGSQPGGSTAPQASQPRVNAPAAASTVSQIANALRPYATRVRANPTGGSANRRQGLFSIH